MMNSNEFEVRRDASDWWFACVDVDIWDDDSLSTIDKSVFTVLCIHASVKNRDCKLKIETIAKKASCSVRSVQNSIKKLTERGLIVREVSFRNGKQGASSFQIIGHKAACYQDKEQEESHSEFKEEGCIECTDRKSCTTGVQDVHTVNYNSFNDIKDSLTREAELPNSTDMPLVFENGQPVTPETKPAVNPEEVCTPDDAPEIMKPTAEYLLHKTGRQGLTWDEISALRDLSVTQYPHRVQKEIDTAVKRFLRLGRSLSTLTFGYIAGSLSNQPTRTRKRKRKPEIIPEVPVCTEEQADAEMAEIEALQAKFDRESAAIREGTCR